MGEFDGAADRAIGKDRSRHRLERRQVLTRVVLAGGAAVAWWRVVESFGSTGAARGAEAHRGPGRSSPSRVVDEPRGHGDGSGGPSGVPGPTGQANQTVVATGLGYPLGLFVVPGKNIYVADFGSQDGNANGQILSVDPSNGSVTPLLSSGDYWPSDVAVDSAGNIYFSDYGFDDDDASERDSQTTGEAEDGRVIIIPTGTTRAEPLVTGLVDPSYLLLDEAHQNIYVSNTGETEGGATANPSGVVLSYPLKSAAAHLHWGRPPRWPGPAGR